MDARWVTILLTFSWRQWRCSLYFYRVSRYEPSGRLRCSGLLPGKLWGEIFFFFLMMANNLHSSLSLVEHRGRWYTVARQTKRLPNELRYQCSFFLLWEWNGRDLHIAPILERAALSGPSSLVWSFEGAEPIGCQPVLSYLHGPSAGNG